MHLIEVIRNVPIDNAVEQLRSSHQFIVGRAIAAQQLMSSGTASWGAVTKRLTVDLAEAPEGVGKSSEKLVEIVNILATTERTISALGWLATQLPGAVVRECHPSTNDDAEGNDIVLEDIVGDVLARCEVCDVITHRAGQDGKEAKDLKNLGCADSVPNDSVRRFIATSPEFAQALLTPSRVWSSKHYRYVRHGTREHGGTEMLELARPSLEPVYLRHSTVIAPLDFSGFSD